MIGAERVDFVLVPTRDLEQATRTAFFTDPDGNGLLLHHRYAPYADGSRP